MGLSQRLHAALGGAIVVGAIAVLHGIPGQTRAPAALHHDHTREWSYIRNPHSPASSDERFFGDVASLIAGRAVEVRCEDVSMGKPEEPGGVVEFNGSDPASYARIRPDECTALRKFRANPAAATTAAVEAVTVLAHESEHLARIKNEAAAQCYAIQDVPRLARAFGASADTAVAMAAFDYVAVQPHMPPMYRSPECRAGGALDGHGEVSLAALERAR